MQVQHQIQIESQTQRAQIPATPQQIQEINRQLPPPPGLSPLQQFEQRLNPNLVYATPGTPEYQMYTQMGYRPETPETQVPRVSEIQRIPIETASAFYTGGALSAVGRSLQFAPRLARLYQIGTAASGGAVIGKSAAEISSIKSPTTQRLYTFSFLSQLGAAGLGGSLTRGYSGTVQSAFKPTYQPGTFGSLERPSTSPRFTSLPPRNVVKVTEIGRLTQETPIPAKSSLEYMQETALRPRGYSSQLYNIITRTSTSKGIKSVVTEFQPGSKSRGFLRMEEASGSLVPVQREIISYYRPRITPRTYFRSTPSQFQSPIQPFAFQIQPQLQTTTQLQPQPPSQITRTIPEQITPQITEPRQDIFQFQPQVQTPRQVELTSQTQRQRQEFAFVTPPRTQTLRKSTTFLPPPIHKPEPEDPFRQLRKSTRTKSRIGRKRQFQISPFKFKKVTF